MSRHPQHDHDSHQHISSTHIEHAHDLHQDPHHDHDHIPNNKKVLSFSFILITAFMFVEFAGGYFTHSLALISDAGHMLSDSVALGIALAAVFIGQKAMSSQKSFGYQRFEILAAALNGLTLIVIAVYIFIEAIIRLQSPQQINLQGMLIISSLGLAVNILVAWLMFQGSDTEHDLNMRGAFLHVLSDLLGSVAAIAAALAIYYFGWTWADPLASVLVAILVLRSGAHVAWKASHILMQGTPEGYDLEQLKQLLLEQADIIDVHDLHVWTLTSKRYILSCHIVVDAQMTMAEVQALLIEVEQRIQKLGIDHVTIQTETSQHDHHPQHPDDPQCRLALSQPTKQHAHATCGHAHDPSKHHEVK